MAQYGHNWYGTAYYGATNAVSGWYQTKEIFTEEALKNTVNINIKAKLPSATYGPTANEVDQMAGTWTYDSSLGKIYSSSTNAQLYMQATCDKFTIKYEQRTVGAKVNIQVVTVQPGVADITTNYVLNTQAASVNANATYEISGLAFGKQQVTITMAVDSPAGAAFNFKGFIARTANLTVESRARVTYDAENPMSDLDYVKLNTTITPTAVSGEYMVSGVTPSYAGDKYIQLKVYLASSDNYTTPEVEYIEFVAGDSNHRTDDGQWTCVFDMAQIATDAGVSFSEVEDISWTESVPNGTSLTIRSQSSTNNTDAQWGIEKFTVPYRLNANRIRLREGFNTGHIDAPIFQPGTVAPYTKTTDWVSWADISFLPPLTDGLNGVMDTGTSIIYDWLNTNKDNQYAPYVSVTNPMNAGNRNLRGNKRLKNFDTVLRITMTRSRGKQTPVVDFFSMTSEMHYEQDKDITDRDFSAVDFDNTGKGSIYDLNTLTSSQYFKIPSSAASDTKKTLEYNLIDNTQRPSDVILYYGSEASKASRSNIITSLNDTVWAQAKDFNKKTSVGLEKHYQYGGGEVRFPEKDEIVMVNKFTSRLNSNLKYRYFLQMGWPQQTRTTVEGDTLENIARDYVITNAFMTEQQWQDAYDALLLEFKNDSINQKLKLDSNGKLLAGQAVHIPDHSHNSNVNIYWKSTSTNTTSKSSTNSVIDKSQNVESDSVIAEVAQESTYGWIDWISEEKIYDGVVNLNDKAKDYQREHPAPDASDAVKVSYRAVTGDTYASIASDFGVYEDDVRLLNNATNPDMQPSIGQKLWIPSKLSLPAIHPMAVVEDNPYEIDIVYHSVKKKDGKIIPESNIVVDSIEITYMDVTATDVPMTRGEIANGKDLLMHPQVVEILSAKSEDGMIIYNATQGGISGDFKQTDNYIDWSPTQAGSKEPAIGANYYVTYKHSIPASVTITIKTTYAEEGGVDRIWRSPEVKEFKGMCSPGNDFVAQLPDFSEWQGLPDSTVEDLTYVIEDNDLWVKTWTEQRQGQWVVVGSLQDRVPKDNWFPRIKTGYYYLGKDEYYMFNEPIVLEPTDKEIPVAKNVEFVEGKFENAVQMQEGSQNIIRNSGFEVLSSGKTVYKLTF